jgi:hypothetical protein
MRLVGIVVAMLVMASPAWAGKAVDKLEPYAGKIVISPDTPPGTLDELPAYLKANLSKDSAYDLVKGPPWPFHLVGVLAKNLEKVTLVIADKADKKLAPLLSIELTPMRKIVIAHAEATIAAGFAANKTYVVRLMNGKTVLAKSEVTLHD